MRLVPTRMFFTRGAGIHREKLSSFELALREAGIAHLNLVYVSSIFPPHCKIIGRKRGLERLAPGEITYCVMARQETNEAGRHICASVGVARPTDTNTYGYLSEHHGFGQTNKEASDYAEDLAASMLATTLGIPFDVDKDYNVRKEQYRMGGNMVDTRSTTQTAEGAKRGLWTTVLAAAVLLTE